MVGKERKECPTFEHIALQIILASALQIISRSKSRKLGKIAKKITMNHHKIKAF
jgi:hypothetical protein